MSALVEALGADGIDVEMEGTSPIALPADEQQVQAVLRRAHLDGHRIVPIGLGSKLPWCRPDVSADPVDLLLSTRRLDQVVDHVPGDGTLTAQAGCTMGALERQALSGGHRLTPAVPQPAQATLGGVIAAGLSGPDRHRRGPMRHHVLGTRVALTDGTLARSGGRLVKNVTGFDLQRLHAGSRGTLCVILEASLRLFPHGDDLTHLTRSDADLEPLLERLGPLLNLESEPRAFTLENHGGSWRLHLALEGGGRAHGADVREAQALLEAQQEQRGPGADEAFDRLRDLEAADGWGQVQVVTRPSRLPAALKRLAREPDARMTAQLGEGTIAVHLPSLAQSQADEQVSALLALREELREFGALLEPRAVCPAAHLALAPDRSSQPALGWMFALQSELDPKGQLRSPSFPGRVLP